MLPSREALLQSASAETWRQSRLGDKLHSSPAAAAREYMQRLVRSPFPFQSTRVVRITRTGQAKILVLDSEAKSGSISTTHLDENIETL